MHGEWETETNQWSCRQKNNMLTRYAISMPQTCYLRDMFDVSRNPLLNSKPKLKIV